MMTQTGAYILQVSVCSIGNSVRNIQKVYVHCLSLQAEAAEDDDTAADNDTHTTHSRDQGDQEISAAADGDDSPSAAAAGDHISAHHEISADDAEADPAAECGLTAGGSQGSEGYAAEGDSAERQGQQEASSYAEEASVQQQNGESEEEEEHDEQAKADQVGVNCLQQCCSSLVD
jgi:hypothetical protein